MLGVLNALLPFLLGPLLLLGQHLVDPRVPEFLARLLVALRLLGWCLRALDVELRPEGLVSSPRCSWAVNVRVSLAIHWALASGLPWRMRVAAWR